MRKYLILIATLVVMLSCICAVSASDVNTTQELTESNTISQENDITDDIASPINDNREEKESTITEEENMEDDCCSAIIQGYNNNSAISFRRDSDTGVTLNVTHDSNIIKQYKGTGSYFFHVIVSKDGWIIGNGGTDDATTSKKIEVEAKNIINNNYIDNETFKKICDIKQSVSKGHFVVKAPDGTYALFINYFGKTYSEKGTLLPGQYLVVPNDPAYFKKGYFSDVVSTTNISTATRLLAARDKYGVERRNILTYYYKNYGKNSEVKIYACNDDGSYANKSTGNLVDSIRTNTNYYPASSIPTVPNSIAIDTVNFIVTKLNTSIVSENITTNDPTITLKATILDENGDAVNSGFVTIKVNDKSLKYTNGSAVRVDVKNGAASIKIKIADLWKRSNYTYEFRYYGNSMYEANYGNKAIIKFSDLVTLESIHSSTPTFGTNVTVTAKVNYKLNNSPVNDGVVIFKIGGNTVRDENGNTVKINVKDGVATYNIPLSYKHTARAYTLKVVFVSVYYREEADSIINIQKIKSKIDSPVVSVTDDVVSVKGKFLDDNNQPIPYAASIGVKVNGITLKYENGTTQTFNITDGVIDFNFTLPGKLRVGNHTLTLLIPELRANLGYRENVTFAIEKV